MSSLVEKIVREANENRKRIINMVYQANAGHPGGSLSMIDILTAIYETDVDLNALRRSKVILSKGHAVPAQYAVLNSKGIIADDEMGTFRKCDSRLQGHPHMLDVPEVDCSTGLLGQGVSLGIGVAIAKKIDGDKKRVYVFVGDGEIVEGQIWEAAFQAAHYKLNNLVVILDYNKLSSSGPVALTMNIDDIGDKFRAFNWAVQEIDGHNTDEILTALENARNEPCKPTAIVAHTIKGKGVSFMENNPKWHSSGLSEQEYLIAMQELEGGR